MYEKTAIGLLSDCASVVRNACQPDLISGRSSNLDLSTYEVGVLFPPFGFLVNSIQGENKKQCRVEKEPSSPKDGILYVNIAAQKFTFCDLAAVTKAFGPDCFIGEGGFDTYTNGDLKAQASDWDRLSILLKPIDYCLVHVDGVDDRVFKPFLLVC
ncbi:Non-specific serine/threonine protein kinase [Bertholletia excelsa]